MAKPMVEEDDAGFLRIVAPIPARYKRWHGLACFLVGQLNHARHQLKMDAIAIRGLTMERDHAARLYQDREMEVANLRMKVFGDSEQLGSGDLLEAVGLLVETKPR